MKSQRTKTLEISNETRKKVIDRQHNLSLTGKWLGQSCEIHHFLERGQSGVGYEWNLIAMTSEEHRLFHDRNDVGRFTANEFEILMANHLTLHYDGWSKDKCKYHKGWEEKDYGVSKKDVWK